MTRAMSVFYPRGARDFIRTHLGRTPRFDNSKVKRELGLEFRDIDQTLTDTVLDLASWGHIPGAREPAA
jgi:dihydroflavonol-4-reductase